MSQLASVLTIFRKLLLSFVALLATVFFIREAPYLGQPQSPNAEVPPEARPESIPAPASMLNLDNFEWNGLPMQMERLHAARCQVALHEPWTLGLCDTPDCQILSQENDFQQGTLVWVEGTGGSALSLSPSLASSLPLDEQFSTALPPGESGSCTSPALTCSSASGISHAPHGFGSLHTATIQCRPDGSAEVLHLWIRLSPDLEALTDASEAATERQIPLPAGFQPAGMFRTGPWEIQVDAIEDPHFGMSQMTEALVARGWQRLEERSPREAPLAEARIFDKQGRSALLTHRHQYGTHYLITVYNGDPAFMGGAS